MERPKPGNTGNCKTSMTPMQPRWAWTLWQAVQVQSNLVPLQVLAAVLPIWETQRFAPFAGSLQVWTSRSMRRHRTTCKKPTSSGTLSFRWAGPTRTARTAPLLHPSFKRCWTRSKPQRTSVPKTRSLPSKTKWSSRSWTIRLNRPKKRRPV